MKDGEYTSESLTKTTEPFSSSSRCAPSPTATCSQGKQPESPVRTYRTLPVV